MRACEPPPSMKGADRQPPRPRWAASCTRSCLQPTFALVLLVCAQLTSLPVCRADVEQLFSQASELQDANLCSEALPLYSELLGQPDLSATLRANVLYNEAVCLELNDQPQRALQNYQQVRQQAAQPELRRDAMFRLAALSLKFNPRGPERRILRGLLLKRTSLEDRARIHIELASVDLQLNREQRAAHHLRRASSIARNLSPPLAPWYQARAQLLIGDLFSRSASRSALTSRRPRVLVRRLHHRAKLLERAQLHYVAAIEQKLPHWAQAGTLHLAQAILELAQAMQALERRISDGQLRGRVKERQLLKAWLAARRPGTARKAFESLQLCLDLRQETGHKSNYSSSCRELLERFPMELLNGNEPRQETLPIGANSAP